MVQTNHTTGPVSTKWGDFSGFSPGILQIILILQKRDDCIQALRQYEYSETRGSTGKIHRVRPYIRALYDELYSSLRRTLTPEQFKLLTRRVASENIGELRAAFYTLNDFLDEKKVIRFDRFATYDTTDPEEENIFYGL